MIIVDDHPSDDARRAAELHNMELLDSPSRAHLARDARDCRRPRSESGAPRCTSGVRRRGGGGGPGDEPIRLGARMGRPTTDRDHGYRRQDNGYVARHRDVAGVESQRRRGRQRCRPARGSHRRSRRRAVRRRGLLVHPRPHAALLASGGHVAELRTGPPRRAPRRSRRTSGPRPPSGPSSRPTARPWPTPTIPW